MVEKMNLYQSNVYYHDLVIAKEASVGIENLKNKKIMITGATGTIGSFLVDMLMNFNDSDKANIIVYALGRDIERLKKRFEGYKSENLIFLRYDISQPITFDYDVDYIVHAAGNAYPNAFNSDPVGTIVGNIDGTYNMLKYGRTHGAKRLLYISSGEVYGQGDLNLDEYEESYAGYVDSLSSRSCYPNSKRTAETLCVSYYKQYGLETLIARPCHTYGPVFSENDNRANVQFFKDVLQGRDIFLNSSGDQLRSYCYVADCASAIITVLVNGQSGEAYNCANPDARITIAGFAKIIANVEKKKLIYEEPLDEDISNQTPIKKQVLSSKKLESLGWTAHYSVEEGILNTLSILKGK